MNRLTEIVVEQPDSIMEHDLGHTSFALHVLLTALKSLSVDTVH